MGRETLRTRCKILTDIAENNSPEVSPKYIVSKHVSEIVQNLIRKLRGGCRKRARSVAKVTSVNKRNKAKRASII